jgi:phosphopantothenoylcysteine synthetase/decarboxylase
LGDLPPVDVEDEQRSGTTGNALAADAVGRAVSVEVTVASASVTNPLALWSSLMIP